MGITHTATVTSKGQVTVPKEIREHLDLNRGETVSFELTEDGTVHFRKESDLLDELHEFREEIGFDATDIETMQRESKRRWSTVE